MSRCGLCQFKGNKNFTAFPPEYQCKLTGRYHPEFDLCDCEMQRITEADKLANVMHEVPIEQPSISMPDAVVENTQEVVATLPEIEELRNKARGYEIEIDRLIGTNEKAVKHIEEIEKANIELTEKVKELEAVIAEKDTVLKNAKSQISVLKSTNKKLKESIKGKSNEE